MGNRVHIFDNGLKIYSRYINEDQLPHLKKNNLWEPEEEPIFMRLLDRLPPGGCYVNIGSAFGYYPLLAKLRHAQLEIHAFEPLEQYRDAFLENAALNGLDAEEFHLHPEAFSIKSGRVSFVAQGCASYLADDGQFTRLHRVWKRVWRGLLKRTIAPAHSSFVKTINLEQILARAGGLIHLLQLDIQGSELGLLESAAQYLLQGSIRSFLIGTHGRKRHEICRNRLARYGYSIQVSIPEPADQQDGILVATKEDWLSP